MGQAPIREEPLVSTCSPHRAEQKDKKEKGRAELAEQEARREEDRVMSLANQVCNIPFPVQLALREVGGW